MAFALAAASPGWAELSSWVDANGNVVVVDDADQASAPSPEQPASTTYQWRDAKGNLQITDTPPAAGGTLLSTSSKPKARPRINHSSQVEELRTSSNLGARFPRLQGVTAKGTFFDSNALKDQRFWAAFVTITCPHCHIEGKLMNRSKGEFRRGSFVVFIRGGRNEAVQFSQSTGLDPEYVVALSDDTFPAGPVPFNVIVSEQSIIQGTFAGRPSESQFVSLARRNLR